VKNRLEGNGVAWMISSEFWATILKVASVPFLVLLNGFFVTAEFALVKIRDMQLEDLMSKGHRRAGMLVTSRLVSGQYCSRQQ